MTFKTVNEIPELWKTKLKEVQKRFPNAVIAGGCLRDWFTGKEAQIKDIDFFLPSSTDAEVSEYLNDDPDTAGQIKSKTINYGNLDNDDINCVYSTGAKVGDSSLEFIAVAVPKAGILDRFDFGLCQIMFDGDTLSYSDQFLADIENKTFTLIRADDERQYDRSLKRYKRLKTKFEGFEFVVEPKLQSTLDFLKPW